MSFIVFCIFLEVLITNCLQIFPNAQGFGTDTFGGSGRHHSPPETQVIRVTSLSDTNEIGTLRYACNQNYPRVVIFDVSGTITVTNGDIRIDYDYITIAGQTSPDPGIQIKGGRITINANHVLIQHIRIRYGDSTGTDTHCLRVNSGKKIVIDHVTNQWAKDEVLSLWAFDDQIQDVTISNCIISDGLGGHGYGSSIGTNYLVYDRIDRISYYRNLVTNNRERFPMVKSANIIIANEVTFNPLGVHVNLHMTHGSSKPYDVSILNNHFIVGNNHIYTSNGIYVQDPENNVNAYESGNILVKGFDSAKDPSNWVLFHDNGRRVDTPTIIDPTLVLWPTNEVKDRVLNTVGSWPKKRDFQELKVISEARDEISNYKNTVADSGGYPPEYGYDGIPINSRTLQLPHTIAPNRWEVRSDGYTTLEKFLFDLSNVLENGDQEIRCFGETNEEGACGYDLNHGSCSSTDICQCSSDWYGSTCSVPVCDSPLCNAHQRCTFPDTCVCLNGWSENDCMTPTCDLQCTGNSECTAPNTCSCIDGWTGIDCNTKEGSGCTDCNVNQECSSSDVCVCKNGWFGENCDEPICVSCNSHQNCSLPNTCSCLIGWFGENCDKRDCEENHAGLGCQECLYGWTGNTCHIYLLEGGWGWVLPVSISSVVVLLVLFVVLFVVIFLYVKIKKKQKPLSNVQMTSEIEPMIKSQIEEGSNFEI